MHDFIWWKHGVIYQIYPRSFKDSNGDGIGDLRGIIEKLKYIKKLGVDAIWLSPINNSPMLDFGYDITDYYGIDPVFGSKNDFIDLINRCHDLEIKVVMDLVVNHTSDQHPWFKESRSSVHSKKRDWYIWRRGCRKKPPNNWEAALGGSAWTLDEETGEYYFHSFMKNQPDLNWRNRELKNEIFKMMAYWLDMGVDGFRIDVVNWFIKDRKYRNNPFTLNIFNPLRHKYNRNRPAVHNLMREFRKFIDCYENKMLVGEVFTLMPGDPKLSAKFLGNGKDQLHMAFDFSLIYRFWSAKQFYRTLRKWYKSIPAAGWPSIVLSNHDQPRARSRFMGPSNSDSRARVAAVFLLTVRGTPFLYYGEELGMKNAKLKREELVDPLGKKYWPIYKGRDIARAPMPWDSSPNAGFSAGEPWLPVDEDYEEISVKSQEKDPYSILNLYRKIIKIRKEFTEFRTGSFIPVHKGWKGVVSFFRKDNGEISFVALNFSSWEKRVSVNFRGQWKVLYSTNGERSGFFTDLEFRLKSYEAIILKKIGEL